MKHRLALSAALVAGALSLAACAPDDIVEPSDGPQSQPSASADAGVVGVDVNEALADMTWNDNGADAAPTVDFTTPINFDVAGTRVIEDGEGEALAEGQMLSLSYVAYSGTDGSTLHSTYDVGAPEPVELSPDALEPTLFAALSEAHVGAKMLYGVPDSGNGAVVMALTVVDATDVLERAEGTAVAPSPGDPAVSLDDTGKPAVDFAGATMPTELVSHTLIEGSGPVVEQDETITVHYTGWVWDGEQFDSSWDKGQPFTTVLAQGNLIDGWIQGLVGKTVGSQVLLVIPPELGYGDQDQGAIPAGSTLVFVVDILAAY